jgi:hypothetical protein
MKNDFIFRFVETGTGVLAINPELQTQDSRGELAQE